MTASSIDVQRATDRFRTVEDGVESWHCFSFGRHYDPANTSYGPLVAHNDTVLLRGSGYAPHRHVNLEIITWVVHGVLHHEDSTGQAGDIGPGVVQRLSAGAGVVHSETASGADPAGASSVRFVQMWLTPDRPGGHVSYAQQAVDADALAAGLVVVVSGRRSVRQPAAVSIGRRGATLLAGRLSTGQSRRLPGAERVHVYVVRGEVELESGDRLAEGDSARLGSHPDLGVICLQEAEILVWELGLRA